MGAFRLKNLVRAVLGIYTCEGCGQQSTPLINGLCASCYNKSK